MKQLLLCICSILLLCSCGNGGFRYEYVDPPKNTVIYSDDRYSILDTYSRYATYLVNKSSDKKITFTIKKTTQYLGKYDEKTKLLIKDNEKTKPFSTTNMHTLNPGEEFYLWTDENRTERYNIYFSGNSLLKVTFDIVGGLVEK